MAALSTNRQKATVWWGDESWTELQGMNGERRAWLLCERFKKELGYHFALPFPIYDRGKRGAVMYHMIHASDHPEAPKFMVRAYRTTTQGHAPLNQQMEIEFKDFLNVRGNVTVDLDGAPEDHPISGISP